MHNMEAFSNNDNFIKVKALAFPNFHPVLWLEKQIFFELFAFPQNPCSPVHNICWFKAQEHLIIDPLARRDERHSKDMIHLNYT